MNYFLVETHSNDALYLFQLAGPEVAIDVCRLEGSDCRLTGKHIEQAGNVVKPHWCSLLGVDLMVQPLNLGY